jgi:hypothetical protein
MWTAIPELTGAFWCRANLPQKVELAELTVIYLSIYLLVNWALTKQGIGHWNQKLKTNK